jgi:DNA-binding MarR family transcriptional regulator
MGEDRAMSDTTAGTAREAWAILVGLSLAQRRVWLEAGAREGLTPPQAISLMRLQPDTPPSLGDLARHMHCDASYATALADRLEERGLVERRVSATDRRVRELVPTAAGVEVQRRLREAFITPPPGLDQLPEEDVEALMRIAERLAESADPEVAASLGIPLPTRPAPGAPPLG